jgi:hypothetical protein
MSCPRFREFMLEQILLVNRHFQKHAYFRGITDHEEAKLRFIEEFGGIIRETYCEACTEHKNCEDYQNYLVLQAR